MDHFTSGCLLESSYFNQNYKLIAIDLSKQQEHDTDTK